MAKESSLSKTPKPNYLRLRVALHRRKNSKDVALSHTDVFRMTHRTPFVGSHKAAEAVLRGWLYRTTGIGKITFIVTEETIE